jgi:hypothetical protein
LTVVEEPTVESGVAHAARSPVWRLGSLCAIVH